ncbi:MAG TPA: hypothetical protein VKR58_10555 [Aquella sp.]|nr:hypothetical protein [Aquella sp.]
MKNTFKKYIVLGIAALSLNVASGTETVHQFEWTVKNYAHDDISNGGGFIVDFSGYDIGAGTIEHRSDYTILPSKPLKPYSPGAYTPTTIVTADRMLPYINVTATLQYKGKFYLLSKLFYNNDSNHCYDNTKSHHPIELIVNGDDEKLTTMDLFVSENCKVSKEFWDPLSSQLSEQTR